ncbi:MAG: aminomethyl-transferring glycine dehydrogenase subunit GcvPB [Planctomycetes bacterium]|nr:aminomethyl-transferring glycine dehydrogenase subunit GcvPB [Planctomycetota bacterium]
MSEIKLLFEYADTYKDNKNYIESKKIDIRSFIPDNLLRKNIPRIPRLSELQVVRHYTNLSRLNMSIDGNFYPLGSCTMKYNPKVNDKCALDANFINLHPLQKDEDCQGTLQIFHELQGYLSGISGMDETSLQPLAGAHSELTGLLIVKAYYKDGKENKRNVVLIPDSAHGTNPATCTMCGFKVREIKTNERGCINLEDLKNKLSDEVACLMITNPNTLGIFEENIVEITSMLHKVGSLVYMDGANMNALIGIVRPGDFGVDLMHFNLHKTFTTPHGGGGPGAGAICVKKLLAQYLPVPHIELKQNKYVRNYNYPRSVGSISYFYGNTGNIIRGYVYIRSIGKEGLKRVAQMAVLNANYLLYKFRKLFLVPYKRRCMHEFVVSAKNIKAQYHVSTLDIVKRLLDYGFHAPTIYFPLIVEEAMLIEPTETEDVRTLDSFVAAMEKIVNEAKTNPELLHEAPHSTPVGRLNEVKAARDPILRWVPS